MTPVASAAVAMTAVATAVVVIAAAVAPASRRSVPDALTSDRGTPRRPVTSRLVDAMGRLGRVHRGRRIRPAGAEEVAEWCEGLARQVRSGATLRHAVETVEPAAAVLGRHLEPLRRRLAHGAPLRTTAATDPGTGRDLGLALDMIAVAAGLGGSPAAALDRTAATLRRRAADRAERRTQAAQARMSAHVLTVVPLGLLVLLVLSDHDVRATVTTPIGAACIAGGLTLNVLGWCWMRFVIGAPR